MTRFGPTFDPDQMADEWQSRKPATPVKFTADNPETTELDRAWPIEEIRCRLTGTYTVSGSSSTLNSNGMHAYNLIRRAIVRVDGKNNVFNVPGVLLQRVSELYQFGEVGNANVAPGTSVGSHDFDLSFTIPINAGPGPMSLLDATWRNQLIMEIQWDNVNSIATAGGSHSLSNVQLHVDVMQRAGGRAGAFGGPDYGRRPNPDRDPVNGQRPRGRGYPIHIIDAREVAIAAAQSDLTLDLIRGHGYSRFGLLTLNDGDPTDAILNNMAVITDQTVRQRVKASQLQAENVTRYGWSARRPGWYVLDVHHSNGPRQPRMSDFLSMRSAAIPFNVQLDVNNPSGDNLAYLLLDRFQPPDVGNA